MHNLVAYNMIVHCCRLVEKKKIDTELATSYGAYVQPCLDSYWQQKVTKVVLAL